MPYNYDPQPWTSEHYKPALVPTMTVGELQQKLASLDPTLPVMFRSPTNGTFGSNQTYSINDAKRVVLEPDERSFEGGIARDEETGEEREYEGWTETRARWEGVEIG